MTIETLRQTTEDDVAAALAEMDEALPVDSWDILADVIGRLFAGPATNIFARKALKDAYVELPLTTTAAVLEAFNCYLDYRVGAKDD
jgi:hypothetical protein